MAICKHCKSENVIKKGKVLGRQNYLCQNCGHKFLDNGTFVNMRTESRIIVTALDLYYEGLSVRKVQTQIAKIFRVKVSQVTVWKWLMKYSKLTAKFVTTLKPKLSGKFKVDETAIKCKGEQKWFWEVLDEDTKFLVATHLSGDRTIEDVVELFEKSMTLAKERPQSISVDGLWSYGAGFNKVFYSRYKDRKVELIRRVGIRARVTNNPVERLHGTLKDRTRVTRGLKEMATVKPLLEGWAVHYDFVRPHQTLGGRTPAEAAGIANMNNWQNLIEQATIQKTLTELGEQSQIEQLTVQQIKGAR